MIQTAQWPAKLSSSLNARLHWRVRAKTAKAERFTAAFMCRCQLVEPTLPVVVTLTRVGPRQLDDDNVAGCFKATRDGVADWLGVDDGDRSKVTWRYDQDKGAYAVRVEIVEVR